MKVDVYNQNGEKVGTTLLPKDIFGVSENPDLIYQTVVTLMANRRKATAKTKDRSEVRGGGRKPWRQKGTGRARHGSRRSPIWKGGGVTFGPVKDRVFEKKINKKMRRKALLMALSSKVKNNLLILLDGIKLEKPKTKEISLMFKKLPCKENKSLLALPVMDKNIITAARNISNIRTVQARDLNLLDVLSFKYLVMPKEAIEVIKETFVKQSLREVQEKPSAPVSKKIVKAQAAKV
ncbi:MAG: 50S ribosomal protein L4 [bacterium]|nr:50S ribosomal protein L4 [bacterium]